MSNKQCVGGYVLVDFGGVDFTSGSPVILAGIHGRIATAIKSGKIIVAVGLTKDGAIVSPFIPLVSNGENDAYIATTVGYTITISVTDGVTVEASDTPSGGDYVTVDFNGAISGETVTGLFDALTAAYESGKPIFATHVHFTGTDNAVTPIAVNDVSDETIYFVALGYSFGSVSSADELTFG